MEPANERKTGKQTPQLLITLCNTIKEREYQSGIYLACLLITPEATGSFIKGKAKQNL